MGRGTRECGGKAWNARWATCALGKTGLVHCMHFPRIRLSFNLLTRDLQCACLLALSACNAILGVKPLEPGSQSEMRGDAVTGQDGGADRAAGSGGAGASGSAGAAGDEMMPDATPTEPPDAGTPEGGSKAPNKPAASGGSGGSASPAPNGNPMTPSHPNTAGTGGTAAAPSGGNVTGRVIDHARRAVPGVNVRIGDKTAQTDTDGRFTLDAPATYDVTLSFNNGSYRMGQVLWLVQGLTRRDPTLQVDRALPSHDATATISCKNLKAPLTASQHINIAWLSPDGSFSHLDSTEAGVEASIGWTGPSSTLGTAHALLYETMGSSDVPVSYLAHSASPLTLQAGQRTELSLDLSQSITSAAVSGKVSGPNTLRSQEVYLSFDDATSMLLLEDHSAQDSFSYVVPRIANATVAVFAQDGVQFEGSSASYAGNVVPGQADVALKLRAQPSLVAPAAGANGVTRSTKFSWHTDAAVSVVVITRDDSEDMAVVVTGKQETFLPFGAGPAFSPSEGVQFAWHVELHNSSASVDDAAGEMGFLYPAPDLRGSGSYADSQSWLFTTGATP